MEKWKRWITGKTRSKKGWIIPNLSTSQLTFTFAIPENKKTFLIKKFVQRIQIKQTMKKALLIFAAVISLAACKTADKKAGEDKKESGGSAKLSPEELEKAKTDTANFTTIEWMDSTTRNLGKLKKGQEVEVTFRFKNSGKKILVIESVSASCGCTIPEKPEKPFAPGEEGVIKAKYNGSGSGTISKTVTVIANTLPQKDHSLTFIGDEQD